MNYIDNSVKIVWINFMLFLITCPVIGQVRETKQLTSEDYHLWSTLNAEGISDHGKWVSYSLSYESKMDTLFVKSTDTEQTFFFPKGFNGKFIGDNSFGYMLPDNRFQLKNLINGKIKEVNQIQSFDLVIDNQYILLYGIANESKSRVTIINLNGDVIETIENVTSFTLNPKNDALAYCASDSIGASVALLQFGKKMVKTNIINSNKKLFENVVWQNEGNSIVFVGRSIDSKDFTADTVLHYSIAEKQLFQYDTSLEKSWPKGMVLYANFTSSLGISDDGARVFFKFRKAIEVSKIKNNSGVQIWNASDKDLFPVLNTYGKPENNPRLAIWWPKSGKFRVVGDTIHPTAILNGNQKFALVHNQDHNKPSFKYQAERDYYLVELETGKKVPFLQKQSGARNHLILSPGGKYILYFRDLNWWLYSFATQTHSNITRNTGVTFYDDSSDEPEESSPFGLLGWTVNDGSLLLYDRFDIWEFSLNNNVIAKKLTHGREHQQIFRQAKFISWDPNVLTSKFQEIDLTKSLLLKIKTIDNNKSGYAYLNKNLIMQSIVFEQKLVSALLKAKDADYFIYLREDFNEPPTLIIKKGKAPSETFFKSNPQHNYYGWGSYKLIEYKNSKGISLNGALFYPFNYDPKQQYPMIVNIYEKKSRELHTYTNPSLLNGARFNRTYFTSLGYFVLLPDIVYEIGNPGFSSVDCVMAATKTAFSLAPIDKNRLGLIGHSFGGYETNFIITQTNLFAAAVAGAGISDLTSWYFSVGLGEKKPEAWRFETQQFRMEKTWFEDMHGYLKNSPLNAVTKVTTPLLSYTGESDPTVNPNQTLEFYLALRRLNKEHIMLIYPKDDHVIQIPKNQIDLTCRLSDWFGYYLNGEKKPDWFNPH
ncbi:MAG: prolyl oligopeptidase family serine peptidase [Lutibacter sp.]